MLDRIRYALVTEIGAPALLLGSTWREWWSLLRDNGFRVHPRYFVRAWTTCWYATFNSVVHAWERRVHESRLADVAIEPPIFILGFYRSGTTHLHNLLCEDPQFAFPNAFQATFPNTFLTTEPLLSWVYNSALFATRPMDNVKMTAATPQEDEFALFTLTSLSPVAGWVFPRHRDRSERYLTFANAPEQDRQRWRAAFELYLRKLSSKYRKPLVLKSPPHTARIAMLLEMFPNARFVHIHRNPYTVFQSFRHTLGKVSPFMRLQRMDETKLDEFVLRHYRETYSAFIEQRPRIPAGQFHELGYDDLVTDPVGSIRGVYEALNLPGFAAAEPRLRKVAESSKSYRPNRFAEMDPMLRSRIASEWSEFFERWGYAK